MQTTSLSVFNIVGGNPFCLEAQAGEKVFQEAYNLLQKGTPVVLSFQNIDMATTAFLNTAIGQLYGKYDEEFLNKNLSIAAASPNIQALLDRVCETAKLFYSHPEWIEESARQVMESDE